MPVLILGGLLFFAGAAGGYTAGVKTSDIALAAAAVIAAAIMAKKAIS